MELYRYCFSTGHTLEEMASWSTFDKNIIRAFAEVEMERLKPPDRE